MKPTSSDAKVVSELLHLIKLTQNNTQCNDII